MEKGLTKEIKTKWLEALKSGEYIQGVEKFKKDGKHCCLGVLCEITGKDPISNEYDCGNWPVVQSLIESNNLRKLYTVNDDKCDGKYTAVIPIIEKLKTID